MTRFAKLRIRWPQGKFNSRRQLISDTRTRSTEQALAAALATKHYTGHKWIAVKTKGWSLDFKSHPSLVTEMTRIDKQR